MQNIFKKKSKKAKKKSKENLKDKCASRAHTSKQNNIIGDHAMMFSW